jgi:RNA polymerase sigma-70 factor (ECF subfamily)
MRHPNERALVDRLRDGDQLAIAELASTYGPGIYQLAFRYLKNREDAEEVAQDVLLKVCRKIEAFRGDAALGSWIYRITFNAAMSRLRANRAGPMEVSDERFNPASGTEERNHADPADWSSLADDRVMRGELRHRLVRAVLELPDIYRAPVVLRDLRGLTTEVPSAVLKVK